MRFAIPAKGLMLGLLMVISSFGQTVSPSPSPSPSVQPTQTPQKRHSFIKDVAHDQVAIWTVPFRMDRDDLRWALPFAAGTAALIKTDKYTSSWVDQPGSLHQVSKWTSYGGQTFVELGLIGGFYAFGHAEHSPRAVETARLSLESLIDSTIVVSALKAVTQRPRPNEYNGRGTFFTGGSSFPSGHSASAWSIATVVAYEYQNRPLVKYGAYAAAAAIGLSRYSGRNHFLSDIVVGSALGFYTGRLVYRTHHISTASPVDDNSPPAKQTTRLIPLLTPIYNAKARAYGATAMWTF